MNLAFGSGLALTVPALAGYVAGAAAAYSGRAFSLTGLMTGLTLVAVGRSIEPGVDG